MTADVQMEAVLSKIPAFQRNTFQGVQRATVNKLTCFTTPYEEATFFLHVATTRDIKYMDWKRGCMIYR